MEFNSEDFNRRLAHEKGCSQICPSPSHRRAKGASTSGMFFAKNGMISIVHPLYSPDLAPCDSFLFPTLKMDMKGKRFATVEEVKQKSPEGLKDIPISEFKNCFEQWKKRLKKCVVVNGEYSEGDQNFV